MRPKISIIVPIYGVEKYLNQCVDSILAQTISSIEVILVDDGSPDRSGAIADAYAEADPRIKVIHQKNAGLGPARNSGMQIATGEYIGFVDSDDWVQPEMFEKLYEAALKHNADIAVGGYCNIANGKIFRRMIHPMAGIVLSSAEIIQETRKNLYGHRLYDDCVESFPMSVCMSLYRSELIVNHRLQFVNILSEDIFFNLDAYHNAKTITFVDSVDYCYRKENQPSITQSFSKQKIYQFWDFFREITRKAILEQDEDCMVRAKRTVIDYCRVFVCMVENTGISFAEKKMYVHEFLNQDDITGFWDGFPLDSLPLQQRVLHSLLEKDCYGAALALCWIRRRLRR